MIDLMKYVKVLIVITYHTMVCSSVPCWKVGGIACLRLCNGLF